VKTIAAERALRALRAYERLSAHQTTCEVCIDVGYCDVAGELWQDAEARRARVLEPRTWSNRRLCLRADNYPLGYDGP